MLLHMLMKGKPHRDGIHRVIERLYYTDMGKIMVSALFGAAFAMLFQRVCKDRSCIVIKAPPMNEIVASIYKNDNACYQYKPRVVPCSKDALDASR